MLVDDSVELQHANTVTIGSSGYRLSSELCGYVLKVTRGVAVCMTKNLTLSWSKGCQKKPYHPCKTTKLLELGKSKVVSREPFTIQLLFGSSGFKQEIVVSCDSGSKVAIFAVHANGKVVYLSEVTLRQDIRSNMDQKRAFRRKRRSRKTRCTEPRFNNRKRDKWLTPMVRSKVDSHKRELYFIKKILPVTKVVIETASFDTHKITNPEVSSSKYQKERQKDFYNVKHYVLHRDEHACKKCNKSNVKLQVHHILFKSAGGTDSPDNLITLCQSCHHNLHLSEKKIPTDKIMGIKKFDKAISNGVTGFVKGRISTGYAILMDINGKKLELKPILNLKNLKRITARKSCLTSRSPIDMDTALRL